jgi:hypothetical protein
MNRWLRTTVLLLIGATCAGIPACEWGRSGSGGSETKREGKMDTWFITYERPIAPPGGISQVVTGSAECFLIVTCPLSGIDLPDRSEIGMYRWKFPAGETAPLKGIAEAAAAEAGAVKQVAMPRGTLFITFGIGEVGREIDRLSSVPMSIPLPPAIKRFDDSMIQFAKKLLSHPHATLKGVASIAAPTIERGQALDLEVVLRNSGTVPVTIRNPAAVQGDEPVGIEVLIEKDIPQERIDEEDFVLVPLARGDAVQLRAPGSKTGREAVPLVRLGPEEEIALSLKIRRNLFLGPGSYRAYVRYESRAEGIPQAEAVQGRMQLAAGAFRVKAKR